MYLIENEYKRELAEMQKSLNVRDRALAEKDRILKKALSENAKIKAKLAELERRLINNE